MTSLERVRNTIAGKPVDHLAAQPMLMMYAARYVGVPYAELTRDGRKLAEGQLRMQRDFDLDVLLTCSDPAREVVDIAGEGSVVWLPDQGPVIDEERAALTDKNRLREFKIPDPFGGGRMHDRIKAIEIMRREVGDAVSVVGWVEGPLALGQELRGLNRIMMDFVDDPGFVHDLLDFTAAVAMCYADAQIAAGADTIGMSDAAASMMGPVYYREFLFPRQLRVLQHIKSKHPHIMTRLHMCGQTQPLIPQMRELPADIYELDFPVDLAQARADLGEARVISGNVSTVTTLVSGTPEEVYAEAARCHRLSGRYHIVNSGCEVSPLTPPENLRALVRYAKEHS
ncbi:MAG: uroporphyrinogen decarboxylase family protein [Verrucomicrobiae bacterium]|nr:uroporphyrinogen decarboxylase family protein [Verrucomicrobiae bacterium]